MVGRRWEWYPAGMSFDQQPIVLHDETLVPMRVLRGVEGIEAPTFSFSSIQLPGMDGVQFSDQVTTSRRVVLPVFLWADSEAHLSRVKSALISAMNPKRGSGRLVLENDIGDDWGSRRWVSARYRSGLEGNGEDAAPEWWRFTLVFECDDPCWYDADTQLARWVGQQGVSFFPYNPGTFHFTPYGMTLDTVLELAGDDETWPVFTLGARHPVTGVVGPWTRARFTLDRTGQWWELRRSPGQAETLVVLTKPGVASVRNLLGENRYGFTPGYELFPLAPAGPDAEADTVSIEVDGADENTAMEMVVSPAWWTGQ